jgi:outer membrane protein assembly factor BamE (lipoprotein component of BamABCDE complex)
VFKPMKIRQIAAMLTVAFMASACGQIVDQRGHQPVPGTIEKLEVGTQGRDDVLRLMGSPSTVATFGDEVWYYISSKNESTAFLPTRVLEQRVIAVSFDGGGRVREIKQYDLKDGKEVAMVSRKTPTSGKELTILEQILGNVGKFSGPKKNIPGAGGPGSDY